MPCPPPPSAAGAPEAHAGEAAPHLHGRHLRIAPPAEALELEGVEAEAHGAAARRGRLLQLQAEVVQVGEVVVSRRPGRGRDGQRQPTGSPAGEPPGPPPAPRARGSSTHSLQVRPWVLGRHRQAPVLGSQPCPSAPPTSHRQPAVGGNKVHAVSCPLCPYPGLAALPTVGSGPCSGRPGPWALSAVCGGQQWPRGQLQRATGGSGGAQDGGREMEQPLPSVPSTGLSRPRCPPHASFPGLSLPRDVARGPRGTYCGSRSSQPGLARRSHPGTPHRSGHTRELCKSTGHRPAAGGCGEVRPCRAEWGLDMPVP